VVLALGGWSIRAPQPPGRPTLSPTSVLLFLRGGAAGRSRCAGGRAPIRARRDRVGRSHAGRRGEGRARRRRPTRRCAPIRSRSTTSSPIRGRSTPRWPTGARRWAATSARCARLLGSVSS